jgi:hypothetical protein
MWAESGATLSMISHPTGGSLESGPLCTGKSTISHNGRSTKSGGQISFTAGASGTVRVVAMFLGSRSGPDCQYEVLELFIPPTTPSPTTATTPATTTTTTTTTTGASAGSTTTPRPGQPTTTTEAASVCSTCIDEFGLLEVGLMGSPKWCGCCAHDCEGIFPDCVKHGFCTTFCYTTPHCDPWTTTTTKAPTTSATTKASSSTVAKTSSSAASTTDDSTNSTRDATTKPQPVENSATQLVVISGCLFAMLVAIL